MSEFVQCPGCNLRHSRRPDGLCPRCHQRVDAAATPEGVYAGPPVTPGERAPAMATALPSLGGLAQSARTQQLKSARGILLAVGILTLLVNGFQFLNASSEMQEAIDAQIQKMGPNFVADPQKVAEVKEEGVAKLHLFYGGAVLAGMALVACGAFVYSFPVPLTIAGLVIYLGCTAVFGFLAPETLRYGYVKIFIVIGLFKAVQAAIAFSKEESGSRAAAA